MVESANNNSVIIIHDLKERMYHEVLIMVNGSFVNKDIIYKKNICVINTYEQLSVEDDIKIVIRNRIFKENKVNKIIYYTCIFAGLIGQSGEEGFIGSPFEFNAEFKAQHDVELFFENKLSYQPFRARMNSIMLTSWISCEDEAFRSWKNALILLVNMIAIIVSILLILMVNFKETLIAISCIIFLCNIILYCVLARYKKYKFHCK